MTQDLAALVAKLRKGRLALLGHEIGQAADALEAQAAEIARLTSERDAYARHLNDERKNYAEQIGRAEKAEAERDQWAAREGAATNTIINLNAELLTAHQALSESQALLAMAFEVAAHEVRGSNLGLTIGDVADDVLSLTSTDAQAALDARINAARKEGRIMGLREGAAIAQSLHDRAATKGQVLNRNTVGKAILAKIKEVE